VKVAVLVEFLAEIFLTQIRFCFFRQCVGFRLFLLKLHWKDNALSSGCELIAKLKLFSFYLFFFSECSVKMML